MRYGLCLPNGGACADARTLAELAHLAEEAGWDGVFLEDYIVWQGHQDAPAYDPWVVLAAMALRTDKIRLGTQVTPVLSNASTLPCVMAPVAVPGGFVPSHLGHGTTHRRIARPSGVVARLLPFLSSALVAAAPARCAASAQ